MKNITNNFNELIIAKTLSNQQTYITKASSEQFSSLLNNKSHEQEEKEEEKTEQEESTNNMIDQQIELQNSSYLNRVFLSSVA